jgi:hypothetical protein
LLIFEMNYTSVMTTYLRRFFLLGAVFLGYFNSFATHLRAGEITLTRMSCSNTTFIITLKVYTKNSSQVKFEGGTLSFGDGTPDVTLPRIDAPDPRFQLLDKVADVGQVTYTIQHTFPAGGAYIITYFERNRNSGILNIANSVDTPFFVQTQIIIDGLLGCDNTPRLLVPPIDRGCTGVTWFHNPGAYDPDGDSLSFALFTPKQDFELDVAGYTLPNSQKFYNTAGIPYTQANEAGNGPPTFAIDPVTGTITWDAPGEAGEYNIAFTITEWRKVGGTWVSLGYVERDMQVIIEDCKNLRPILDVPADLCVVAGTVIDQDIFATDQDGAAGDSVKIEAFSQIFTINPSSATYTPGPAVWQPTFTPSQQASIHFQWKTDCKHIQDQPYIVVFKATDNGSPRLATFKTWTIRVIGPPPQWGTATLNAGNRSSTLTWNNYACSNASTMQIWRRVDSYPFTPPPCLTGIPDALGYSKVGEVPIGTTTFVDKGLAAGAEYCYRLVAVFPNPPGGVSVVSDEICIPPIIVDAPVITNVTVDKTDTKAGQITVKWRSPFQVDQGQFPKPYTYEVYRAEGLAGKVNLKPAFPGKISDSTFVDTDLNTSQLAYNYRVLAYDNNGNKLDTSAVASSVRLELKPLFKQIELSWTANVPWSNNTIKYPKHWIYRGLDNGTVITDLTLIDSVNVNQYQFQYTDSGQWNKSPLSNTQNYCYAVMTKGTYGNPKIQEPLKNFSEITCTTPDDKVAPCSPVLSITGIDCTNAGCVPDGTTFTNVIKWKRPADAACRADTKSYNVYAASFVGQTFVKIAENVVDTFYVHSNLPSYAQCYQVTAVDRAGNESKPSDSFCFDNCPNYELPNVFTPNGDNCNDVFSAYSLRDVGEGYRIPCNNHQLTADELKDLSKKCARFVQSVAFKVYNRWGKEVYTYQSGGERTIYIDWDGRDNNGFELSSGVYYYSAVVNFNVVDPKQQIKTIKGWVQIVR